MGVTEPTTAPPLQWRCPTGAAPTTHGASMHSRVQAPMRCHLPGMGHQDIDFPAA